MTVQPLARVTGRRRWAALMALLLGAAAAAPAAAQTPDELIGTWSFDGSCASSDGMGLSPDGEVWFDEWGWGLWVVESGRILMILQESEMGADTVIGVSAVELRIDGYAGDRLNGTFLGTGQQIEAVRCG